MVSVDITPDTRKLDLSHGNFTSLPDGYDLSLFSDTHTHTLSLSLSLSPCRLFAHTQLTEMVAGYNRLTAIPPAIGNLHRLSVLDLRSPSPPSPPPSLVGHWVSLSTAGITSCGLCRWSWHSVRSSEISSSPSTVSLRFLLSSTGSRNWSISSPATTRFGKQRSLPLLTELKIVCMETCP